MPPPFTNAQQDALKKLPTVSSQSKFADSQARIRRRQRDEVFCEGRKAGLTAQEIADRAGVVTKTVERGWARLGCP